MKTTEKKPGLYWSERGEIACHRHGPAIGTDTWIWDRWSFMDDDTRILYAAEIGCCALEHEQCPPRCETCGYPTHTEEDRAAFKAILGASDDETDGEAAMLTRIVALVGSHYPGWHPDDHHQQMSAGMTWAAFFDSAVNNLVEAAIEKLPDVCAAALEGQRHGTLGRYVRATTTVRS
jgi:hypothetical protein